MPDDVKDQEIIKEAKDHFRTCEEWEGPCRVNFDYDYKFANADAHNMWQWDNNNLQVRIDEQRPCLTINKTKIHNLMVINDAKQNKPGVNIRPVGEEASFEAAQVFQEVVRHIEYISNAENVYDYATQFQVDAGWAYWRIVTEYFDDKSFDQEIYIRRVNDPKSVYLDPDIKEADGSDARFGFIFEDMPLDLYKSKYPKFKDIGWKSTFNNQPDTWLTRSTVKVCEYYRKTEKEEKLVTWISPNSGEQLYKFFSELTEDEKGTYKSIKSNKSNYDLYSFNERHVVTNSVEWFKIAGDTIIERGPWLGKYIPIVRLIGTETVVNGLMDRKGHTRSLIDPQRIYNVNASCNVEFGALQTKVPWLGPAAAIEGHEAYWGTANTKNHSVLPYNHIDDDGNPIPPPVRPQPPQSSPAYIKSMEISENQMMMATGQYQAQMGENENAKSGIAINARQRQGDRATYHFIDNLAIAVRFTGKILIDLIPKVYDTKRVYRISAADGSIMNVTIDVNAKNAYEKLPTPADGPQMDKAQQMSEIIFNPSVGIYDVQSDTGPSFATRRQEAFNALTQIAAQNKEFMGIAGDVLWKVADFPEAQVLMERWRRIIPKNITGDAMDPKTEEALHAAAAKIEQLVKVMVDQAKEIEDKDKELEIKRYAAETQRKTAAADANRLDYDAETKRLTALGNSGEAIKVAQIQPVVKQLLQGMLRAGELGQEEDLKGEGGQAPSEGIANGQGAMEPQQAPDGQYYIPDPNRPGKYLQVQQ